MGRTYYDKGLSDLRKDLKLNESCQQIEWIALGSLIQSYIHVEDKWSLRVPIVF